MKQIILFVIIASFTAWSETLFQVKDSSDRVVLDVSTDGLRVLNEGDTLMVISSDAIRANIGVTNKGLSRAFSVTTTQSKGKGLINALEVDASSATMTSALGQYTDFSPENIFVGLHAGQSTTGTSNVFIGNDAGFSNTTGLANVFIGHEAGYSSQDNISNTYVGHAAGKESTGGMNAFFGYASGYTNKGDNNSFFGQNSGSMNSAGSNNCLFGYYSGVDCDGSNNTMIGTETGKTNAAGWGNVFIGYRSGMYETGSNRLYIANSNTATPLIKGIFPNTDITLTSNTVSIVHPVGQTTNGLKIQTTYNSNTDSWHFYQMTDDVLGLYYNTSLRGSWNITSGAYTSISDKKLKKNIDNIENVSDKVLKLSPKRYNYISQKDGDKKYIGLIAQEVMEYFPEFVNYSEEAGTFTMDYSGMSVVAIQAIKEQQYEIENLRKENESIKKRLAEIEAALLKIR